jgi:dinuclear metal center protein, YbgI/SA1388 family
MRACELASVIESFAPLTWQEAWDNSGFCVGSPQTPVKGVLLCLDLTEAVLEEALSLGANMIISHHPLIFQGLKQLCEQNETARLVAKALRQDMVIYACHTNLDKAPEGVSRVVADALGLKDLMILRPELSASEGLGLVGNLPEPEALPTFLQRLKGLLQLPYIRTSPHILSQVERVAICGGSAASLMPEALRAGADIFLGGDFRYHDFFPLDPPMMIADIGHYESEIGIIDRLFHILSEKKPNFAVYITRINTNPIYYF